MTLITFKNGLPLLLQPAPGSDIGLVAADSGCCCPPPPPERCWEGSFCSYFIELVEPSELAVKTTAIDCQSQVSSEGRTIPTLLAAIFSQTGQGIFPLERNQSTSNVSNFGSLVAVSECEAVGNDDFVTGDPGLNYQLFGARRSVGFSVATGMDPESGQPVMKSRLSLTLSTGFSNFFSGGSSVGSEGVRRSYEGLFDIPSTCVVSPERECFPFLYDTTEFLRINTPLEVTVGGDGTSSLGSLDFGGDETFGDGDTGLAAGAIEVLAAATSYTFRITARENCLPPENVCCCLENTVTVSTAEECEGTTSAIADPVVDPENITIITDWDGLTAVADFASGFSSSAFGVASFSCLKDNEAEAFDAMERSIFANYFLQNTFSGQCLHFSSSIVAFFTGVFPSNNFEGIAQSSGLAPYVGECKLLAPVDEDDTSCTFTQSGGWCMDNPFSDTVTVEMIIAP